MFHLCRKKNEKKTEETLTSILGMKNGNTFKKEDNEGIRIKSHHSKKFRPHGPTIFDAYTTT